MCRILASIPVAVVQGIHYRLLDYHTELGCYTSACIIRPRIYSWTFFARIILMAARWISWRKCRTLRGPSGENNWESKTFLADLIRARVDMSKGQSLRLGHSWPLEIFGHKSDEFWYLSNYIITWSTIDWYWLANICSRDTTLGLGTYKRLIREAGEPPNLLPCFSAFCSGFPWKTKGVVYLCLENSADQTALACVVFGWTLSPGRVRRKWRDGMCRVCPVLSWTL